MPSYYEILHLPSTATTTEIEGVCDALYNKWRQLISHPNAQLVEEANRNLRIIEGIRGTLGDATRRAAYDATLNVGGLADPEALLRQAGPMTPPVPRSTAAAPANQGAIQPAGLWACPNCSADNPAQTEFCYKCGTQLVRQCPECKQKASLVATGFCGKCGYKYEAAQKRVELKVLNTATEQEVSVLNARLAELNDQGSGSGWIIILLLMLLCGIIFIFIEGARVGGIVLLVLSIFLIWFFISDSQRQRRDIGQEFAETKKQLNHKGNQLLSLKAEFESLTINREGI